MINYKDAKLYYPQLNKSQYTYLLSDQNIIKENRDLLICGTLEYMEQCIDANLKHFENILEYEEVYSFSVLKLINLVDSYNANDYKTDFLNSLRYRIYTEIQRTVEIAKRNDNFNYDIRINYEDNMAENIEKNQFYNFMIEICTKNLKPKRLEVLNYRYGLNGYPILRINDLCTKFNCNRTYIYLMLKKSHQSIIEYMKNKYPEDYEYFKDNYGGVTNKKSI